MAIASTDAEVHYPESDGKPMAETPQHRDIMFAMIAGLRDWFVGDPTVYVSGNMFLYYVEGQSKFNVSPDVMVVRGVAKNEGRRIYQTWKEGGKAPDLVIEVTSSSTKGEDKQKKYRLYRDKLKVREYILFDPYGEWLRPPLQGYRLVEGEYAPIAMVEGRLPSEILGLHLEGNGENLRLFNPATRRILRTARERAKKERLARRRRDAAIRRKDAKLHLKDEVISLKDEVISLKDEVISRKDEALRQAEAESRRKDEALRQAEAEQERLRREVVQLKASKQRKRS